MNIYDIRMPFGMLDAATQKALKNHNGQIELFKDNGWAPIEAPNFYPMYTYRARPLPREWWLVLDPKGIAITMCDSRAVADKWMPGHPLWTVVHVREVQ